MKGPHCEVPSPPAKPAAPQCTASLAHIDRHTCCGDVLQLILSTLSQQDTCSVASVCKDWLNIVNHHLVHLTLHNTKHLPRVAARFTNLERVSLHNARPSPQDLHHIAQLRCLRTLILVGPDSSCRGPSTTLYGLDALAAVRTLTSLSLHHFVLLTTSGLAAVVCKRAAGSSPNQGALLQLSLAGCTVPERIALTQLLLVQPRDAPGGMAVGAACVLQHLDVGRVRVHSACAYAGLRRLSGLRTLVTGHASCVDDVVCMEAAHMQHLHTLDVSRSGVDAVSCGSEARPHITDAGVAALAKAPRLQSLLLVGHAGLTHATAQLLCSLHALRCLDLRQPPPVPALEYGPAGYFGGPAGPPFDGCSVERLVQSLALSGRAVDGRACRAIGSLKALTSLELLHASALTDGALCMLEPLTSLRRLALVNCDHVTDIGVTRLLRVCRGLRHVQLAHVAKITALSLQALRGLPLVTLDLSGSAVRGAYISRPTVSTTLIAQALTDVELASLVHACPRIEALVLQDCERVTDEGVASLAGLHNLQHLNLQLCIMVTAAGLRVLAGMPQLTSINVYKCSMSVGEADACGFQRGVQLIVEKPFWWLVD